MVQTLERAQTMRTRQARLTGLAGFVTIDEVSRLIGKSYWSTRRWLAANAIHGRLLGTTLLYPLVEVQRALANDSRSK